MKLCLKNMLIYIVSFTTAYGSAVDTTDTRRRSDERGGGAREGAAAGQRRERNMRARSAGKEAARQVLLAICNESLSLTYL